VNRYNNPINDSKERKDACQKPEFKTRIYAFSFYGVEKRDQSKPNQKFEIEIREGEDEEET
jgi:hypothetical protein